MASGLSYDTFTLIGGPVDGQQVVISCDRQRRPRITVAAVPVTEPTAADRLYHLYTFDGRHRQFCYTTDQPSPPSLQSVIQPMMRH